MDGYDVVRAQGVQGAVRLRGARTPAHRPNVTFETNAHLVPGYLHAQIGRLPKIEPFAALVLYEAPEASAQPRRLLSRKPAVLACVWMGHIDYPFLFLK